MKDLRGHELELVVHPELFAGLDHQQRAEVFAAGRRYTYAPGDTLFREGEPAERVYLVESGRVKMTQLTPDGKQVLVRFVDAGDMLGGAAIFQPAVYPATAWATEECVLWVWDGGTMHRLMEQNARIALNALQHAAWRVHELQYRVQELVSERVEQRVARALLRLSAQNAFRSETGRNTWLRLSRQEVAEWTGTTVYTASRILRRWERMGWIITGREKILIRCPQALEAIAHDGTVG